MDEATIALTIATGAIGLIFLGFLIWALKSGQFHDIEAAKYQVFRRQKSSKKEEETAVGGRRGEVEKDAG